MKNDLKKYNIEFIEIGREKFSDKTIMEADRLNTVCLDALHIAKTKLISNDVYMAPDHDQNTWQVIAGFRKVGQIKIEEIQDDGE